jgi:hypothetical protein
MQTGVVAGRQVAQRGIEAGGDRDQGRIGKSMCGQGLDLRRRAMLRLRRTGAEREGRQGRRQAGAAPSVEERSDFVAFPVSAR